MKYRLLIMLKKDNLYTHECFIAYLLGTQISALWILNRQLSNLTYSYVRQNMGAL